MPTALAYNVPHEGRGGPEQGVGDLSANVTGANFGILVSCETDFERRSIGEQEHRQKLAVQTCVICGGHHPHLALVIDGVLRHLSAVASAPRSILLSPRMLLLYLGRSDSDDQLQPQGVLASLALWELSWCWS